MSTETGTITTLDSELREPGDHEKLSHYVDKGALEEAIFNGTPCVALCGHTWVPRRDPQKFPVCPECKEIWESMPNE